MKQLFMTVGLVLFLPFVMSGNSYSACEGDLNCSGTVDGSDLALFAADFGTTDCGSCDCDDVLARINEMESRIAQLEALLVNVTRNGDDIYIDAANLHIRNGTGSTDGAVNGLGNLIVGYNELRGFGDNRTGSHNIVGGSWNNYSSYGGMVIGYQNTISGIYSAVNGGYNNTASGNWSSVNGGNSNTASIFYSSVSGGCNNTASGQNSSVSGGNHNTASGTFSSVSGGRWNVASGQYAFVGGGGAEQQLDGNEAFADYSSILGGVRNSTGDSNDHTIGMGATISGGAVNSASGRSASISGGLRNGASGDYSNVSGGFSNLASEGTSSIVGNANNTFVDTIPLP